MPDNLVKDKASISRNYGKVRREAWSFVNSWHCANRRSKPFIVESTNHYVSSVRNRVWGSGPCRTNTVALAH